LIYNYLKIKKDVIIINHQLSIRLSTSCQKLIWLYLDNTNTNYQQLLNIGTNLLYFDD